MAPEYLSSNVMNFLVYRYLNESGYIRAADRLHKSWLGSSASADPERLPFAKSVKRHALIDLVQDGLFLDRLEASAKGSGPRFRFGTERGPEYALQTNERRPIPLYRPEKQTSTEREMDAEEENGIAQELVPPRSQKRKRKSGTQRPMNGDTMDVDGAEPVQPLTVETSVEPMEIESRALSPIVTTAEIGVEQGTQIGKQPKNLTLNTSFIKRSNPISTVEWSVEHPHILLAAGTDQAVISAVNFSSDTDIVEVVDHALRLPIPGNFEVKDFCWTEPGEAVLVVTEITKDSQTPAQTRLVRLRSSGDTEVLAPVSGIVYSLKYDRHMKRLLCLCVNVDKSIFHIWRFDPSGSTELVGRKRPEGGHQLFDAAWMNSTQLLACGVDCVQLYETDSVHGVTLSKNLPEPGFFAFRLQREAVNGQLAVVISEDMKRKAIYTIEHGPFQFPIHEEGPQDETREITDFAFEPETDAANRSGAHAHRVAFSYNDGFIELWSCRVTDSSLRNVQLSLLRTFAMDAQAIAMVIAFSPDGLGIAAAGFDTLMIWRIPGMDEQNGSNGVVTPTDTSDSAPLAVWKWSSSSDRWKGLPTTEDDIDWAQSLKWTTGDGFSALAFALDDTIAVIPV